MLPTPSTSHINTDLIYEPAEDSFLLIDTLSSASEISFLTNRFAPPGSCPSSEQTASPLVIEIGVGSGVISAFITAQARRILGRSDVLTLGTDVNALAAEAASVTARKAVQCDGESSGLTECAGTQHGLYISSCLADLGAPFLRGSVDVLIFNPPYVPTDELPEIPSGDLTGIEVSRGNASEEQKNRSDMLALSWAGGLQGMVVTSRLLEQIPVLLNPERGVAYILLCAQNRPRDVIDRISAWGNRWYAELIGSSGRKAGWEKLVVLRIYRV